MALPFLLALSCPPMVLQFCIHIKSLQLAHLKQSAPMQTSPSSPCLSACTWYMPPACASTRTPHSTAHEPFANCRTRGQGTSKTNCAESKFLGTSYSANHSKPQQRCTKFDSMLQIKASPTFQGTEVSIQSQVCAEQLQCQAHTSRVASA